MSETTVALTIGTRKGAFVLRGDASRSSWTLDGPHFLGNICHHMVLDPRDGRTLLLAARTGHLGHTIYRSTDLGATWAEAEQPPAFPKAAEGEPGRAVSFVFWLTPGHPSEPDVWYAGTSPQGLFRSEDGGKTWDAVTGYNDHPMLNTWNGGPEFAPPGGATLHSINVDPRDARHLYLGTSCGGAFESTDRGETWSLLNRGLTSEFLPDPNAEYPHDVHCLRVHPAAPDRLYHQNHVGVFRMNRRDGTWVRIGQGIDVGDGGFPLVVHPRDPETVWTFPMDVASVWPRTSPAGRPAAYVTRNGGETWQRQDNGFPTSQAWFTVYRQALAVDARDPVGLYVGTGAGEVWASADEGASWQCLIRHLPPITAVEAAELAT